MRALILRLRIWWLERDINTAEQIQNRLRRDLPAMHNEHRDLLQAPWALESDQPA
jgi:hypothetical protein